MNDLAETKKFFEDLMSGNYEVFDFSNPMQLSIKSLRLFTTICATLGEST